MKSFVWMQSVVLKWRRRVSDFLVRRLRGDERRRITVSNDDKSWALSLDGTVVLARPAQKSCLFASSTGQRWIQVFGVLSVWDWTYCDRYNTPHTQTHTHTDLINSELGFHSSFLLFLLPFSSSSSFLLLLLSSFLLFILSAYQL